MGSSKDLGLESSVWRFGGREGPTFPQLCPSSMFCHHGKKLKPLADWNAPAASSWNLLDLKSENPKTVAPCDSRSFRSPTKQVHD